MIETRGVAHSRRATAPAAADRPRWWLLAGLTVVAAFAIRASLFGNPRIEVDESFYLLVGDRMLHGALPYVDIWDRKPIGLFLIYAATRLLGGAGFVQYQVVATLFAAGTALLAARIAWRMTTPAAAGVTAIFYLLLLGLAGGTGGQAPVFYNLFVAAAALATLEAFLPADPDARAVRRLGAIAMLLVGVAMQIKYTAMFEGIFFGLVLLHRSWRASHRPRRLAADAAIWIALALAPTLAALLYYLARGQGAAFVYANFLSIGSRSGADGAMIAHRLLKTWLAIHVPVVGVLLSVVLEPWRRFPGGARTFGFTMMWLGAAAAGYLLFGTYFDHYALPLMVPLATACAPLFGHRPRHIGRIAALVVLPLGAAAYAMNVRAIQRNQGGTQAAAAMVAAIRPHLRGCLYVFDGDSVLYYLTNACAPTRYAFPTHLTLTREAGAIGIDPVAELGRVMATRPSVVVDTLRNDARDENPVATTLVRGWLRRDYRATAVIPLPGGPTIVYARLPGR